MKYILVATDFSPAAENALNYAADMAMAVHAKIAIFHVYQLPVVYTELPVAPEVALVMKDAEASLNTLREKVLFRFEARVEVEIALRSGGFFEELESVCNFFEPYVVVMGSQGSTAADRFLFGGHTVYAMQHLQWPLITVPPKAKFLFIHNIGLACDFNNVVESIPIDELKILVDDFKASLHILNIGKSTEFSPNLVFESALLQEMLLSMKPEYHFITNDNVDEGIIQFAEDHKIDLLIVLPKRHSLLARLVRRSHTKQIVLHSHVPVLSLH